MSVVFWLVLIVETGAPLHVGTFPDLDSCKQAAAQHIVIAPVSSGDPTTFVCVQANRGLKDDPIPPG
jgi:hypothetical protein